MARRARKLNRHPPLAGVELIEPLYALAMSMFKDAIDAYVRRRAAGHGHHSARRKEENWTKRTRRSVLLIAAPLAGQDHPVAATPATPATPRAASRAFAAGVGYGRWTTPPGTRREPSRRRRPATSGCSGAARSPTLRSAQPPTAADQPRWHRRRARRPALHCSGTPSWAARCPTSGPASTSAALAAHSTRRHAVVTWREALRRQRAWVRQLEGTIERRHEDRLMETIERLDGRPFPATGGLILQWTMGRVRRRGSSREAIYCAELVATTYQHMGLLPSRRPASWYDPGRFWSGDRIEARATSATRLAARSRKCPVGVGSPHGNPGRRSLASARRTPTSQSRPAARDCGQGRARPHHRGAAVGRRTLSESGLESGTQDARSLHPREGLLTGLKPLTDRDRRRDPPRTSTRRCSAGEPIAFRSNAMRRSRRQRLHQRLP